MHKPFRGLRPLILATAIQLALAGCGAELTPAEYVRKAQTHLDQGDLQAASVELANALKQDPNLMEARWLMAQLALQTGDAARAERDVKQAITFGLPRATGQREDRYMHLLCGPVDVEALAAQYRASAPTVAVNNSALEERVQQLEANVAALQEQLAQLQAQLDA